jgi:hypothetical protein
MECLSVYHCMKGPPTYYLRSVRTRIKNETTYQIDNLQHGFNWHSQTAEAQKHRTTQVKLRFSSSRYFSFWYNHSLLH